MAADAGPPGPDAATGQAPRRLFVYNGGFLTQGRVRRILELAGWDIRLGAPAEGDWVGVWGMSPTAPRGEAVAARREAPILRVEDAFLRSVLPGREGEPPLGLLLDKRGVHFDPSRPSDLEVLLAEHPLDDTVLLDAAREGIEALRRSHLSKYCAFDPRIEPPKAGYVLVIDQTEGDASVRASRADRNRFLEMLFVAREEHPGAPIVVKSHAETAFGHRPSHLRPEDMGPGCTLLSAAISPHSLLEGARAVYTVSSQMGFEAIFAGHRPVVFGQPFYAGWGLTDDRMPVDRRQRRLSKAQLFAAAMLLYPTWYDPYRDSLASFERTVEILDARSRAWRADRAGWVGTGIRLWKRAPFQKVFGRTGGLRFVDPAPKAVAEAGRTGARLMVWASKTTKALDAAGAVRVEDGFLRSRGLGADLIPPLSLVTDTRGIYYDATRASDLEHLIETGPELTLAQTRRAEALIRAMISKNLTKYNLGGEPMPPLPEGRRILVPGQVEDDASIRLGCPDIRTNRALLEATRTANPAAVLLYKPHPDVEAGLRPGAVPEAGEIADLVLDRTDPTAALSAVDEVWTLTSLIGFEALIRGLAVTCLGQPFYAGWGLTDDRAPPMARRSARPDLTTLVHRALIEYPRYFDPVTGTACPVEVIVDRLADGPLPRPGPFNRSLAKLQGLFAGYAWLWRR